MDMFRWLFPYTTGALHPNQAPATPQQAVSIVERWRRDNQDEIGRFGFYLMLFQCLLMARDNTSLFAIFLLAYFMWLRRNIN